MPTNSDIEALSLWVTSFAPLSTSQKLELLRGTNTSLRLQRCNESIMQYLQRFNLPNLASTALSSASGAISTALRGVVEAFMESSHSEDDPAHEESFDYTAGGIGGNAAASDNSDGEEDDDSHGEADDDRSYQSAMEEHDGDEYHEMVDAEDDSGEHGDAEADDNSGGDDPNLYA